MIIYNFFKHFFLNIKYTRILKKIYKNENLLENLSTLFGTKFRMDWIGRVYSVINPLIVNGKYDPNNVIFEYNENGLVPDEFVEQDIMKKLNVANSYLRANNLFELLTYKINRLDTNGNYLFIFQPCTLEDCLKYSKRFCILLLVIAIAILLLCLFVF